MVRISTTWSARVFRISCKMRMDIYWYNVIVFCIIVGYDISYDRRHIKKSLTKDTSHIRILFLFLLYIDFYLIAIGSSSDLLVFQPSSVYFWTAFLVAELSGFGEAAKSVHFDRKLGCCRYFWVQFPRQV